MNQAVPQSPDGNLMAVNGHVLCVERDEPKLFLFAFTSQRSMRFKGVIKTRAVLKIQTSFNAIGLAANGDLPVVQSLRELDELIGIESVKDLSVRIHAGSRRVVISPRSKIDHSVIVWERFIRHEKPFTESAESIFADIDFGNLIGEVAEVSKAVAVPFIMIECTDRKRHRRSPVR